MKNKNELITLDLVVKETASRLKDPEAVKEKAFCAMNQSQVFAWNSLALSHGYSGLLVLMAALEAHYPSEGWDHVVHQYVLKIKGSIEAGELANLSLFGGLAGSCFAIQYASKGKTRYLKLIGSLNSHLFQKAPSTYLEPLFEKIELGTPSPPDLYDTISGLTGVGIYALSNLDDPPAFDFVKKAVKICIGLTKDIEVGPYTVPGWYVPCHYQFTDQDKQLYPKGNFNLGLAHGVTSLMAFLSIASLWGIEELGHKEAIHKIAHWLESKKRERTGQFFWPNRISFEEEVLGGQPGTLASMEAWCYGTAGVSRSLYLAGKALKNQSMQSHALNMFFNMLQNINSYKQRMTPTFCHGLAGILTIARLMERDAGSASLRPRIKALEMELLKLHNSEYTFGFRDLEAVLPSSQLLNVDFSASGPTPLLEVDKVGMLDGTVGILLALLSSKMHRLEWTLPFLIEGNKE